MADYSQLMNLEKQKKPVSPAPPLKHEETPVSENQFASKLARKQTSKEVHQQISKPANPQTHKEVSQQTSLLVNQQTSKTLKKFGSYLTEESIRALKRIAFDTDRKDYEVLQEAVDAYLQRVKA